MKQFIINNNLKTAVIDALGTAKHDKPFSYIHSIIMELDKLMEFKKEDKKEDIKEEITDTKEG